MVSQAQSDTRPVVLQGNDGSVIDVAATNQKGANKSIEQGILWVVNPVTGRLLPYGGDATASTGSMPVASLTERNGWYLARVSPESGPAAQGTKRHGEQASTEAAGPTESEATEAAGDLDFSVIDGLWQTIRERNRTRPEGSYTSHLFREGEDKIRKKTGEEAVELLLSRSPSETTHEAADLIYHLLVLLESTGLGVTPVLEELAKRNSRR